MLKEKNCDRATHDLLRRNCVDGTVTTWQRKKKDQRVQKMFTVRGNGNVKNEGKSTQRHRGNELRLML